MQAFSDEVHILNLTTLMWRTPPAYPGNVHPGPRDSHAAAIIGDRMVIHGGDNGTYLCDMWSYNLLTNQWTELKVRWEHCKLLEAVSSLTMTL